MQLRAQSRGNRGRPGLLQMLNESDVIPTRNGTSECPERVNAKAPWWEDEMSEEG
jgi:hypothetical protein